MGSATALRLAAATARSTRSRVRGWVAKKSRAGRVERPVEGRLEIALPLQLGEEARHCAGVEAGRLR